MFESLRVGAAKSPAIVLAVFAEEEIPDAALDAAGEDAARWREARTMPGFKADAGEVLPVGSGRYLLGLGKRGEVSPEALRTAGAKLVRALDRPGPDAARLVVHETLGEATLDAFRAGRCFAEGMGLANWRVDFFDGKATKRPARRKPLTLDAKDAGFKKGLKHGLALAESTNYARRVAATPPNVCNPTWMQEEATRLAKQTGLSLKVIDYARARKLGMGGLVNVGKGSEHKPCLIVLEHKPEKAKKNARLAFVGKTMTYDTGGYSLKVNNSMKGMKYDKNGGMAVLGAMHAVATLGLPVHVIGLLPTAENMVAGDAYRPDDIIEMFNGTTVEVTNTDAEGRLVMADALAWACREYTPTAIVDVATLTGGVVVALGSWCAGLWCRDDALQSRLEAAAEVAGEKVWPLPLWEEHRDFMRAKHADVWNSGPKRDGHPIQGAAFLSFFVEKDVPWAHLDIAGTSAVDSDTDLFVTGPTGYGVRLLTELVKSYAGGWG